MTNTFLSAETKSGGVIFWEGADGELTDFKKSSKSSITTSPMENFPCPNHVISEINCGFHFSKIHFRISFCLFIIFF